MFCHFPVSFVISQSAFLFSKWTNLHKLCCLFFVDKSPLTLSTNLCYFCKNFGHFAVSFFHGQPFCFPLVTQRSARKGTILFHYTRNLCVALWRNYLNEDHCICIWNISNLLPTACDKRVYFTFVVSQFCPPSFPAAHFKRRLKSLKIIDISLSVGNM